MIQNTTSAVRFGQADLWKTDMYLRKIEPMLPAIKLLSLDIFDTLLFRACSLPSDVFVKALEKGAQSGILRNSIAADAFREIRIQAELQARQRQGSGNQPNASIVSYSEVTLEEIYAEIPASICDRGRMLDIELETEKEICYLNPNMASLLKECRDQGIQVALLSDMYLSTEQLSGILQAAGLHMAGIDALLISNEQGGGKVSGELFDRLLARFPLLGSQDIVHIGDNLAADVHGAASRDIASLHYPVIPEHGESPFHWDTVRHADMLPQLRSLRKLAGISKAQTGQNDAERFFHQFGATVLGPFLQGWCDWVIDECIRENRKEVHPLMREAYLLGPMLEEAARLRGVTLAVKPVYVSRQATYLASLEQFGEAELNRLLELNWITIGDLFTMLDIADQSAPFQSYLQTPIAECCRIAEASGRTTITGMLREFMLGEKIQQQIHVSITRNRKLFVDYLLQEFGSMEHMVTVDIGFNGTIQKAIETALRLSNFPHRMIHLIAVGTERLGKLLLDGMDIRCFLGGCGENSDLGLRIARSPAFLEELMMGEFGSTLRYKKDYQGVIQPVLAELVTCSSEELHLKKTCQEGAFAFQRYYAYLRQVKPELLEPLSGDPREWSKALHRVIDMPTPEEVRRLGNLTHQENFGGVQVSPVCNPVAERWFEQGEEAFIDFCNYGPSTFNAFWPQGMITRESPYYLYRYYLRQQDLFGSQSLVLELIQQVKQDGHSSVHIVGKGVFAEAVQRAAIFHGLTVECCWSSPNELTFLTNNIVESEKETGHPIYINASLQDIQARRSAIEQICRNAGIVPLVYDLSPDGRRVVL